MTPLVTKGPTVRQLIQFAFFIALAVGALWYLGFQARNLLRGPELTLANEPDQVEHERTVELTGNAKNITALTLNGNPIFTDQNGDFNERLVLENGYTIMTLRATDRFGRETTLSRSFVYTPL